MRRFHRPNARKIMPLPRTRYTASLIAIDARKRLRRPPAGTCASICETGCTGANLTRRHGIFLQFVSLEFRFGERRRLLVLVFLEYGQVLRDQSERGEPDRD